jgi:hypothetical protein
MAALFIVTACGNKEEASKGEGTEKAAGTDGAYSTPAAGGGPLPEGHPTIPSAEPAGLEGVTDPSDHPASKTHKDVKVSDEVAAAWKGVKLGVSDATAATAEILSLDVGATVKLGESGFTLKVEAFLPDYAMFTDHIGSRSKELNNPAVLVELFEGEKSVAKGWIFKNFTQFNSYKNERFSLELVEAEAA